MEPARLIVADSHEIVREGLANKLRSDCGYDVVGQAADGYSTIKLCRTLTPEILVMGLSLTRPSGLDTFTKIRSYNSKIKIVVMSQESNATDAFTVLADGAHAYVPRDARVVDLVNAVRSTELGYACVPNAYIREFTNLRRNVTRTGNIYGLSPRELEVVEACISGAKTKEVADMLSISVRTVETHRNSIYRKTDCRNISELSQIMNHI
ncbi:MAG: response regulator transcription factor [Pseudomonadota bacterium]